MFRQPLSWYYLVNNKHRKESNMNYFNKTQVQRVLRRYNAEHDIGPDAPVTWREEALASAVMDLNTEVEAIKAQVAALLAAVPSAKVG